MPQKLPWAALLSSITFLAACSSPSGREAERTALEDDGPSTRSGSVPAAPPADRAQEDPAAKPADPPAPERRTKASGGPRAVAGAKGSKSSKAAPRTPRPVANNSAIQDALLKDLKSGDARRAEAAFWRISDTSRFPAAWVPALLDLVENGETSSLERIKVLYLGEVAKDKIFLASNVRGMGRMEEVAPDGEDVKVLSRGYTYLSLGKTPSGKVQVVIHKLGGLPVGVVVRAALINRFHSPRYPATSENDSRPGVLTAWWREYYDLVKGELDNPAADRG